MQNLQILNGCRGVNFVQNLKFGHFNARKHRFWQKRKKVHYNDGIIDIMTLLRTFCQSKTLGHNLLVCKILVLLGLIDRVNSISNSGHFPKLKKGGKCKIKFCWQNFS